MDKKVVDLRWGVSDETTDDHQTAELCKLEIERCLRKSIATSFIFFSSQRYGWRPLPKYVDAAEMEAVLGLVGDERARRVAADWYKKDSNTLPPRYVLQNKSTVNARADAAPEAAIVRWDRDGAPEKVFSFCTSCMLEGSPWFAQLRVRGEHLVLMRGFPRLLETKR